MLLVHTYAPTHSLTCLLTPTYSLLLTPTYSLLLTHSPAYSLLLTHSYLLTHSLTYSIEADKKAKSKSYVNSGTFKASGCFIEEHPSLTDYVLGGCEMSLMVAIDFTAR